MAVKETVQALGGTGVVAARLGLTQSAVRNWSATDSFPPALYLEIAVLAEEKKVFLDKALFRPATRETRALRPLKGEGSDGKAAAE